MVKSTLVRRFLVQGGPSTFMRRVPESFSVVMPRDFSFSWASSCSSAQTWMSALMLIWSPSVPVISKSLRGWETDRTVTPWAGTVIYLFLLGLLGAAQVIHFDMNILQSLTNPP